MSATGPVLLWNNSVATLGSPLTPLREFKDRGDGLMAFREFIEQMEPQPAAIRILYASPSLSQVTTTESLSPFVAALQTAAGKGAAGRPKKSQARRVPAKRAAAPELRKKRVSPKMPAAPEAKQSPRAVMA